MKPVSLSYMHGYQLAKSNYYCSENLSFSILNGVNEALSIRMLVDHLSHLSKNPGINVIGFGQIHHSASKITCLPWVDRRYIKTRSLKRASYCCFRATSSLYKHKRDTTLFVFIDE